MRINIPKLIVPQSGVPVGQPRPLEVCPNCRYVLSNSGKCENILCALEGGGSSGGNTSNLKFYNNCSLCQQKCTGH
ncbi:MAG: hypothetical protein H0V70_01570 [Ktedonobacteraceae bacterium]|nr:hypothetical protein [Ktedonobacteraceae bacterium]